MVPTNRKQAVPRSRNRGTNYPRSAVSSKAQEATKLNFELANANKKEASRIARREEAQRKFQIRATKKKAKHKGK
ncbi:DUF2992 family protein [Corynebacterium striatum]|uniref:DUF2992 family protein n=1 Tax=Corynebacterium striatum TaxID=43770 RepID=UPI003B5CB741